MEVNPKLKSAVIQLKSGNDEAFSEVYASTYNYVYFRARQIMKNEEDAMDLMQIVYMEAYKSIANLDKPESIYSWLSSITFRQGMKLFQKNKEILLDEDFENIFDSVESSDRDSMPEHSLERKEQQELLASLIDSLPEVQRATMVAFYYDNIKIEEIADVMGCSVGTVKSRLSYARQALKKKLEAEDRRSRRGGAGKMALTAGLIFGAIQVMSEETILAAPLAAGAFGNICSGLGIAATGAALAGTALAGGAGISAATGTVTTSAGAAAMAGSATAGTAAAAGGTASVAAGGAAAGTAAATTAAGTAAATTAAGTAAATTAAGTAAATTMAGTAGAAAAGSAGAAGAAAAGTAAGAAATTVAAGGAAKGIAVAVAVAVAGTGGTVGTTIYRNTVSDSKTVSANEESSNIVYVEDGTDSSAQFEETKVTEEVPSDVPTEEAQSEGEASTEISSEESLEETAAVPEVEKSIIDISEEEAETESDNSIHEKSDEEAVSDNSLSENAAETEEFSLSDKAKKHAAGAVASLFIMSNGNVYNGEVSNDTLEAAYLIEKGLFMSGKEIRSLSANQIYLKSPEIDSAVEDNGLVVLSGSFLAGVKEENGSDRIEKYNFVLTGVEKDEKGSFERFYSTSLSMNHAGTQTFEVVSSPVGNEEEKLSDPSKQEEAQVVSGNTPLIPVPEPTPDPTVQEPAAQEQSEQGQELTENTSVTGPAETDVSLETDVSQETEQQSVSDESIAVAVQNPPVSE